MYASGLLKYVCMLQDDFKEFVHGHVFFNEVEVDEEGCSIIEPATADLAQDETMHADMVQADAAQADTVNHRLTQCRLTQHRQTQ